MAERYMDGRQIWQSQNFLKRPEFVSGLVDKANLNGDDLVVEIGPGRGIITQELAGKVGQVYAVETDHKLVNSLREKFKNVENVSIVEANFLDWQLPKENYKVFSNIPFNMTADIMRKLTMDTNPPQLAYLIMQDKAIFRFMGEPMESQMSILLKPWFDFRILEKIRREEFSPAPNVNTVLAEMSKKKTPMVNHQLRQSYRDFVTYGYNQWQPTVMDAFKNVFSAKQRSIISREFGVEGKKPSELSVQEWIGLFNSYSQYVSQDKKELVKGSEKRLEKKQEKMAKQYRTR